MIKRVYVPQPELKKYETDGKLFDSKEEAELYLHRKNLTPVYVVLRPTDPRDLETFSTRRLAEESLKHVPDNERMRYLIIKSYTDEILR